MNPTLDGEKKTSLQIWPNVQDNIVIATLNSAPSLSVDGFARLLCKNGGRANKTHVSALRNALIQLYRGAAQKRLTARAAARQIRSAQQALSSFVKALEHLNNVGPPRQRGLQSAFGSPVDDFKGTDESNEFHLLCRQLRLDAIPLMLRLSRAIDAETAKPKATKSGERKKRLRILVEALVDWWTVVTGKLPAPCVYAKRLEGYPAMVIDRQGEFIALARALFCEIDQFKVSEATSTVTNVHEDYLKRAKTATKPAH